MLQPITWHFGREPVRFNQLLVTKARKGHVGVPFVLLHHFLCRNHRILIISKMFYIVVKCEKCQNSMIVILTELCLSVPISMTVTKCSYLSKSCTVCWVQSLDFACTAFVNLAAFRGDNRRKLTWFFLDPVSAKVSDFVWLVRNSAYSYHRWWPLPYFKVTGQLNM